MEIYTLDTLYTLFSMLNIFDLVWIVIRKYITLLFDLPFDERISLNISIFIWNIWDNKNKIVLRTKEKKKIEFKSLNKGIHKNEWMYTILFLKKQKG